MNYFSRLFAASLLVCSVSLNAVVTPQVAARQISKTMAEAKEVLERTENSITAATHTAAQRLISAAFVGIVRSKTLSGDKKALEIFSNELKNSEIALDKKTTRTAAELKKLCTAFEAALLKRAPGLIKAYSTSNDLMNGLSTVETLKEFNSLVTLACVYFVHLAALHDLDSTAAFPRAEAYAEKFYIACGGAEKDGLNSEKLAQELQEAVADGLPIVAQLFQKIDERVQECDAQGINPFDDAIIANTVTVAAPVAVFVLLKFCTKVCVNTNLILALQQVAQ